MRMMNASRPDLPYPVIRLIPGFTYHFTEADQKLFCFRVKVFDMWCVSIDCIQHFTIHVKLELMVSSVTDADRPGHRIAGQPGKRFFFNRGLSEDRGYNLHLWTS